MSLYIYRSLTALLHGTSVLSLTLSGESIPGLPRESLLVRRAFFYGNQKPPIPPSSELYNNKDETNL